MPTATPELRDLMEKWFGDPISEYGPMGFLQSRGYKLTKQWCWEPPVPSHSVSFEESQCLWFLITEWDFGGVL